MKQIHTLFSSAKIDNKTKFLEVDDRVLSLIQDALDFYLNDAKNNLRKTDLGDIERRQYMIREENTRKLLQELEKI